MAPPAQVAPVAGLYQQLPMWFGGVRGTPRNSMAPPFLPHSPPPVPQTPPPLLPQYPPSLPSVPPRLMYTPSARLTQGGQEAVPLGRGPVGQDGVHDKRGLDAQH